MAAQGGLKGGDPVGCESAHGTPEGIEQVEYEDDGESRASLVGLGAACVWPRTEEKAMISRGPVKSRLQPPGRYCDVRVAGTPSRTAAQRSENSAWWAVAASYRYLPASTYLCALSLYRLTVLRSLWRHTPPIHQFTDPPWSSWVLAIL